MRLDLRQKILTLVVMLVPYVVELQALPAPIESRPDPKMSEPAPELTAPKKFELESVELREQAPLQSEIKVREYTPSRVIRKHSRTGLVGFWSGALAEKASSTTNLGLTLDFQNDNSNETGQSFGLTVLSSAMIGAHLDYHQTCCLGDYNEPFWSVGVGSLWSPAEALASFINVNRYQLRVRGGFEDLFRLKRRLRAESILQISPMGFSIVVGMGWTWDQKDFWF